jgi:hypothetical protein
MANMYRLALAAGLGALAVFMLVVGLTRNTAALLAPVHLLLFIGVIALYLAPTALAIYRDCKSVLWIAALNTLLGWTLFGWVIALGWAASGEERPAHSGAVPHAGHPVPGH